MTGLPFDVGIVADPFASLAAAPPGPDVYPPSDFRVEWGPVFHRGRLNGTARLLVVGQDPAQHEVIARRTMVGSAGRRAQGLLTRLGLTAEYVVLNTYLYSVYGQRGGERHIDDQAITDYRNAWFDAVKATSPLVGVLSFGHLAATAVGAWPGAAGLLHARTRHPTFPDSSAANPPPGVTSAAQRARAMADLCATWNAALDLLAPALGVAAVTRYGEALTDADLTPVPLSDLPAGTPGWMAGATSWAQRTGEDPDTKRATITVTVPAKARIWRP